ncbi:unnamed protein product [Protopolystoma xenopodis]|uniref:Uncharacterized protein n=1 Tax=Protopolystoma xenopodis TaxID=117903 RepID=A0A3S5AG09_9PLAT|nr:unnamed protein product [Protopolystoma xenopodis]
MYEASSRLLGAPHSRTVKLPKYCQRLCAGKVHSLVQIMCAEKKSESSQNMDSVKNQITQHLKKTLTVFSQRLLEVLYALIVRRVHILARIISAEENSESDTLALEL